MPDTLLLIAALAITLLGMGWLALAIDMHWKQVRPERRLSQRTVVALRVLGAVSLLASLWCCLLADTATMAVLVWMMLLAVAAMTIALVLSCRPRVLLALVAWSGGAVTSR